MNAPERFVLTILSKFFFREVCWDVCERIRAGQVKKAAKGNETRHVAISRHLNLNLNKESAAARNEGTGSRNVCL